MPSLTPKEKRQARIISLQAIYAHELKGSDLDETCNLMIDGGSSPSEDVLNYGKQLSSIVITHTAETDKLIRDRSQNWDFERITIIDKLILRMALSEMIYINEVPPKVSITEGVEIAKQFSTEDSSSFINGILDAVYNELIKKVNIL